MWRVVPERRAGKMNTKENVFDFHKQMGKQDQRFSPKGRKGLFISLDQDTALSEFNHHYPNSKSYIVSSKKVSLDKVLDLTDPKVLKKLGVKKGEITHDIMKEPDAYLIPNVIREVAQEKGFKAIKFPSSIEGAGDNLVIFDELVK